MEIHVDEVINLDFSHEDFWKGQAENEDMMKFVRFVNPVLLHAELLKKFHFVWKPWCNRSQVISWISTAITRNVRELFLCLDNCDQYFEIPSSVFSCETLQYMELNGGIISLDLDIVGSDVSLPRLESLKLVSVSFCPETFQNLIWGCPMLNYLHIDMDINAIREDFDDIVDDGYLFNYVISSTSLRRLELYVSSKLFDIYENMPHCALHLDASSLEYLKLVGFISRIFVSGGSLSSLVEADLQIKMCAHEYFEASICNSLVVAVRTLDCAKALSLSRFTLLALSRAIISLSTKFKRLTKLEVGTDCCCGSLQDFIQSSDSLEVLTIYQHRNCVDQDDHKPSTWIAPLEVPRCLSNSLKVVVVEGYAGFGDDTKMIGYMLKHGSVLDVMEISCAGFKDGAKFELLQQICKLPRKSPACTVDFIRQRSVSKLLHL